MKFFVSFAVLGFLSLSSALLKEAESQSVNLTSPTVPVTVYEGDDYASSVLGNPWDENERRDMGWEENLVGLGANGIKTENGIFKGTFKQVNGYFFPLFQGFTSSIFAEGLPGDRSLPRFGRNNPIDSSKYNFLSYRMYVSEHTVASVSWSKTTQTEGGGWPAERATYFDGYYGNTQGFARSGWFTYLFDMANLNTTFGPTLHNGTWSGQLISLRIEPSSYAGAGTQLQVDWVRLVDPASAPSVTINWNSAGLGGVADRVITVAYTTNPADRSQGAPIANFPKADPGTFTFPLAALPPGDYYFFVYAHPATNMNSVAALSGLSAKITVLPAPSGYFTSPTQASGEDYATTVLGNPWDMDGASDVDNLRLDIWPDLWRQFSNHSFSGGIFSALADPPLPGMPHSDNQVHMTVSPEHPIDTNKFRYINYKVAIDESNHPTIAEKVNDGWVMRVVGFNHSALNIPAEDDSFLPAAHVLYEGDHTYTYDLWNESNEALDLGKPFKFRPWMYHFRLDPLEVVIPTRFSIDYVTLNAEPRPNSNGIYPVSYVLEGTGNSDVSLYYDNDKSGFNGTLITSFSNLPPGSHSYNWNTSGLNQAQKLYVYMVVTRGTSTRKFYSPVPIALGVYVDPTPPVPTPEPTAIPTPTAEPRGSALPVFKSVSGRPGSVKRGKNVKFSAEFIAGTEPSKVVAKLVSGKKSFNLSMKAVATGKFEFTWKAAMVSKKSRDRFSVTYSATNRARKTVTKTGAAISVSR
jgi:hypothetical protein